ncbi:hypothetical protein Q7P37_009836 [Cladosporium fusiforme]
MHVFLMTKLPAEPNPLISCEIPQISYPLRHQAPLPPYSRTDLFLDTVSDAKAGPLSCLRCAIRYCIPTLYGFVPSWIPIAHLLGSDIIMSSVILDGYGGRNACDDLNSEHLSALTSPTSGPDAKVFSMLQDVSGGCWARICHHISWNGSGGNEAESVKMNNIMTQDTDPKTPEIVKECVSRELWAGTVHPTQRTHSTVGIEVDASKRAEAGDSHLPYIRRQLTIDASAGQPDAELEEQHPEMTATVPAEGVALEDNPNLGTANSLYPQALTLPPCRSSTTGSADIHSIAASSGPLSPWLMPKFHVADTRLAKGSTCETSRSSSACSFDVDEIIDIEPCFDGQPRHDGQPYHDGSKNIEGKFRQMWQKVQSRSAKRRGTTGVAKSNSWW